MIRLIPTRVLNRFGFRQPAASIVRNYFMHFFFVFALFAVVYTLTAHLAGAGRGSYNFAFGWERHIPVFGPAVWIYLSVVFLFVLPPFCVRRKHEIAALSRGLCLGIVLSGICFYLFPAEVIWPRTEAGPGVPWALSYLHQIDRPTNTLPSLHVFFATVFLAFVGRRVGAARVWTWSWWFAICASVLFVHQHHILDIVAGVVLALAMLKWVIDESHTKN